MEPAILPKANYSICALFPNLLKDTFPAIFHPLLLHLQNLCLHSIVPIACKTDIITPILKHKISLDLHSLSANAPFLCSPFQQNSWNKLPLSTVSDSFLPILLCIHVNQAFMSSLHLKALIKGTTNLRDTETQFFVGEGIQQSHEMLLYIYQYREKEILQLFWLKENPFLFKFLESRGYFNMLTIEKLK